MNNNANVQQQHYEPHKNAIVRAINFLSLDERKENLLKSNFNMFKLLSDQVTFDLISYGTSGVSQKQFSAQFIGDEAYAGSRNFEYLHEQCIQIFGHSYLIPCHNILGAWKIIWQNLPESKISNHQLVVTNSSSINDDIIRFKSHHLHLLKCRDKSNTKFPGNINFEMLNELDHIPNMIIVSTFSCGRYPIDLTNLLKLREYVDKNGILLIIDASRIVENSWYIKKYSPTYSHMNIAQLVKLIAATAHVIVFNGAESCAKVATGGLILTNNPVLNEKYMNDVVVYEGLHTYGGMSGRLMQQLAVGINEMCDTNEVSWIMQQTEQFTMKLKHNGIPLERGCDGAYISACRFIPHENDPYIAKHSLSVALYYKTGIRCLPNQHDFIAVQIPRLSFTNDQLDYIATGIIELYSEAANIPILENLSNNNNNNNNNEVFHDKFRGSFVTELKSYNFDNISPFITSVYEIIGNNTSRVARELKIREAGYNTFLLRSEDVIIDLLTDSGTSAMSTTQWSHILNSKETTTNNSAFQEFYKNLHAITGHEFLIPTHQGRAAEQILSEILIKPDQIVPGNMYFTTTKLHQELAGGKFVDVICDEAFDPTSKFRWKGNIDLKKLNECVINYGAKNISYISYEHSVNMAGGQPVSMENMRQVKEFCFKHKILVFFDATRCVENAHMIKLFDEQYKNIEIKDILKEMFLYSDGATFSGKKDFLINIGGVLSLRDSTLATLAYEKLQIYEGGFCNGGLSVADVAAMARGIYECCHDDHYIRSRIAQTHLLGSILLANDIPIVEPPGSHAIFLDCKRFLPHITQDEFPAQSLAAELYIEGGIRSMERGIVSKGRDPNGKNYHPKLELVRLTIPRRVYSNDHIKAVAFAVIRVYKRRNELHGLKFVYEPKKLRFFQSKFEKI